MAGLDASQQPCFVTCWKKLIYKITTITPLNNASQRDALLLWPAIFIMKQIVNDLYWISCSLKSLPIILVYFYLLSKLSVNLVLVFVIMGYFASKNLNSSRWTLFVLVLVDENNTVSSTTRFAFLQCKEHNIRRPWVAQHDEAWNGVPGRLDKTLKVVPIQYTSLMGI